MKLFERFAETYEKIEKFHHIYKTAESREESEAADTECWRLRSAFSDEGFLTFELWCAYENARRFGNERLDIRDMLQPYDVPGFVEFMQQNEVQEFTFHSFRYDELRVAWEFQKCGCVLAGLVDINGYDDHRYPAFLFKIK